MLGVTTALTSDVPAIPLFWVLPLALYLLSFVLVFSRRQLIPHIWMVRTLPFFLVVSLVEAVFKLNLPLLILFPLYLLTLFQVAMVCHGELALHRPRIKRLTEFYLWISFGGVLGGIFNSLVAPLVFSTVLEFPLILLAAALLRPAIGKKAPTPNVAAIEARYDLLLPLALGLCLIAVIVGLPHFGLQTNRVVIVLFVPILVSSVVWCLSFSNRPMRFAAGMAALMAASLLYAGVYGQVLHVERDFFGVLRVTKSPNGKFRYLIHGGTLHGSQSLDAARSREPLAYYTPTGPAGSILHAMQAKTLFGAVGEMRKARWAVVGLGAGAMACYLQPGESLTYYEIDPAVKSIALNPRYFTFLEQCAPSAQIVLGDARLKLRDAPDGSYDLIVLDAFSGDTIPMHLLTKEALALYVRKLAPGGIVAFHISNLYLRLGPTLGVLARDAGLVCLMKDDSAVSPTQMDAGKMPSRWVVMARSRADLGALAMDTRWVHEEMPPGTQVWTDDYSNLLRVIKWN